MCLRKTRSGKSHEYGDAIVFEKLCFQNIFRPHENEKPAFSSGLKSVFEKLGFRDGLVWTVDLTVETKLPVFKCLLRVKWTGPKAIWDVMAIDPDKISKIGRDLKLKIMLGFHFTSKISHTCILI